jgi:glutathione S-transferase
METMIELYFAPGACSFVPHVGLELIRAATGTSFEAKLVKLHKSEHRSPDYVQMNPDGQVPVLVVDGKPLTQIVAICDYLDRRFPQVGLLPADLWSRAQATSLLAWMNNTVHPTFTHIFRVDTFAKEESSRADVRGVATALYRQLLGRLQDRIARADPWLLGDKLSFVDAYTVTLLRWGGMAGIDPDSLPTYKAYVERLAQQPAIAAALERERLPLHTYKKPA